MPTAIDLLRTLADTPDLPGAACVEHREVFDACTERGAFRGHQRAIRICAGCPVLAQCFGLDRKSAALQTPVRGNRRGHPPTTMTYPAAPIVGLCVDAFHKVVTVPVRCPSPTRASAHHLLIAPVVAR